jgi:hypothetical protein
MGDFGFGHLPEQVLPSPAAKTHDTTESRHDQSLGAAIGEHPRRKPAPSGGLRGGNAGIKDGHRSFHF